MTRVYINPDILKRFNELIAEGERLRLEARKEQGRDLPSAPFTQWITSSLNLLDKLSVSTNRFVREFERYGRVKNSLLNIGLPLGVLRAACEEYKLGFAVDYHLAVASTVFGDLLSEAQYLEEKGYLRAAVVLTGAALEEGLRSRARVTSIKMSGRETLVPLIHKLKAPDVGVLDELEASRLEVWAKMRNQAAHGEEISFNRDEVARMRLEIGRTLETILSQK